MCIYIYMYMYMYTYVYIYIYIQSILQIYICNNVYIYIYLYLFIFTSSIFVYIHVHFWPKINTKASIQFFPAQTRPSGRESLESYPPVENQTWQPGQSPLHVVIARKINYKWVLSVFMCLHMSLYMIIYGSLSSFV